ncbi:MAG TPA: enoyl-CoA hydratase-related protein [Acidimicrobiales bacterium]|nr:enoyl-CoA hydratase-related protein [Acidimicrobiales bacterium]
MAEGEPPILSSVDGAVRHLVLNRPSRLNAFTAVSYRALARLLREAEDDPGAHVVVLRGNGRAFCSGVDLDSMAAAAEGPELAASFDDLIGTLVGFTKPLVAAAHGSAVGFGATILLHCDVVFMAHGTRLRFPFTSLRTVPEAGSSVLLPALVGPQHAAALLYTSRWIEDTEALALGLAYALCPPDLLVTEATQLARSIAAEPPAAVMAAKTLLRAVSTDSVSAALRRERDAARALKEQLGPRRLE